MLPIALITGASAGLGVDFARQLSARGHRLVLAARRADRLEALADELGNARAVGIDLSAHDAAHRLLADVAAAGEQVELLINNAGFGLGGNVAELDAERQRQMIDLNIGTLTDLCRAVAPGMIARRSGAILNVASTAAFQPGPGMAVYFATKAYVLSFTEALHEELKPHGIKVSALCPGPTRTEFGDVAGFRNKGAFDRLSMESADVVRQGLQGLDRNQAVVVTGAMNKVGALSTRFVPRAAVRKIAGKMKFMATK
ncbi:SDR family oxidoreductase [Sphingomonas piscis]|uniref:SDR family oxidoreductase n=1 Tax=Sphingomonas piscis TaxID=2714943 RepID=A0A6G7YP86_9SPHN|nr:SDR family oxidoreductase [Sphingomonas piscis]QIK78558.1 SDR family oxidoreductase [Sphingomonas piscis]